MAKWKMFYVRFVLEPIYFQKGVMNLFSFKKIMFPLRLNKLVTNIKIMT